MPIDFPVARNPSKDGLEILLVSDYSKNGSVISPIIIYEGFFVPTHLRESYMSGKGVIELGNTGNIRGAMFEPTEVLEELHLENWVNASNIVAASLQHELSRNILDLVLSEEKRASVPTSDSTSAPTSPEARCPSISTSSPVVISSSHGTRVVSVPFPMVVESLLHSSIPNRTSSALASGENQISSNSKPTKSIDDER